MDAQAGFRLLTEYHSFLLEYEKENTSINHIIVSVSLRSIIHSYDREYNFHLERDASLFPSPYGVSFILIKVKKLIEKV